MDVGIRSIDVVFAKELFFALFPLSGFRICAVKKGFDFAAEASILDICPIGIVLIKVGFQLVDCFSRQLASPSFPAA